MFFMKTKTPSMTMAQAKKNLESDNTILLIDVRTPEEYQRGHIPNSINLPLDQVKNIDHRIPNRSTRLFVYCQSGMRSRSACEIFAKMGYINVTNIGGITSWSGKTERGNEV